MRPNEPKYVLTSFNKALHIEELKPDLNVQKYAYRLKLFN